MVESRSYMFNLEYIRIRHIAEQNNATLEGNHPCLAGCSECCTKSVPISSTDAGHVRAAVRSGAISQEVVEQAKQRANTSTRSCAFLAEGKCSIYKYRPAICIITGSGGIPSTKKQLMQLNSGAVKGLPVKDISTSMCRRGHNILAQRNTYFTRQALEDMQELAIHYAHNKFGTTRDLAKWL